jgi:hypothetical protein
MPPTTHGDLVGCSGRLEPVRVAGAPRLGSALAQSAAPIAALCRGISAPKALVIKKGVSDNSVTLEASTKKKVSGTLP